VAVQAIIFAYIGIMIPDLNSNWLKALKTFKIEGIVLFSVCFAIVVGTKLTIFVLFIVNKVSNCRKKLNEEEEDCSSTFNDDVKTCVSLDVTLESISHIRKLADFDIRNDLEISLDSIIVPKLFSNRKTCNMSCIGKTIVQKK